MDKADVTPRVWQRILDIRAGKGCACCGDWTDGEQTALNIYAPLARRDMGPIAIGQIGQSLDGRVATVSGDARDISGPDGLRHLHRLRALVDAVVIGVRTALHDNPRLTVRLCPGQNPARVIIDPRGRLPDDAPALRDDGARRIVVQTVARARPEGVEIVRLPSLTDGTLAPRQILSALLEFGLNAVLVEGGGITVSRFFRSRVAIASACRRRAAADRRWTARVQPYHAGRQPCRCAAPRHAGLRYGLGYPVQLRADRCCPRALRKLASDRYCRQDRAALLGRGGWQSESRLKPGME